MKMDVPELLAKATPWYSAAAFAVVVLMGGRLPGCCVSRPGGGVILWGWGRK